MGGKKTPGLYRRGEVWHIRKTVCGRKLSGSAGTGSLDEAEKILAQSIAEIRERIINPQRRKRIWEEAVTRYLNESTKATLANEAIQFKFLHRYLTKKPLDEINMGTMQAFIADRRKSGVKTRTINAGLQAVRHVLNLAAGEWFEEDGKPWLMSPPRIKLLPQKDVRSPYPLSWEEQEKLFAVLPEHLRDMALFKVNTGTREAEVCGLRWEWEVNVPELQQSVFIIPREHVKNRFDRLVVLNKIARSVVDRQRGRHPDFVFTYQGQPIRKINSTSWRKARRRVGLEDVRVHDLKHTYGARLRAAQVPEEDRKELLGHKSGRSMTTHYSAPDLLRLVEYSNRVVPDRNQPRLVLIKPNSFGRKAG